MESTSGLASDHSSGAAVKPLERHTAGGGARKKLLAAISVSILAAELVLAYVNFLAGLAMHSFLVFYAFTHYSIVATRYRRQPNAGLSPSLGALPAVGFVPLIRVLSAGAAVKGIPAVFVTGVVVVPVLIGAVLGFRVLKKQRGILVSTSASFPLQFLIGLSGAALGLAGFFAIRPDATPDVAGQAALGGAVSIMALAGVAEEVVFRGLIQSALEKVAGIASVWWSGLLFATLYIGSRPLLLLPFMAAAGLYFGWCARRSRSIIGVCIAHALTNVVLILAPSLI